MGELLGDARCSSPPLEGAMLLLSAYYHDIGMVFDADELAALRDEEGFDAFLGATRRRSSRSAATDEIPAGIAEWFCRWRHADRV